MRVGIMLRAYDERGGVGVYTRNITKYLIAAEESHEFVLYVDDPASVQDLALLERVEVRPVRVRSKFIWDQLVIPYRFWRDSLDVVFHPKFTVPLLCWRKSVMVLHGAGWFIPETRKYWSWATRAYTRLMMPIYCWAAGAVAAVSHITREVFVETLGVSPDKITTVYFAPGDQFQHRCSSAELAAIRQKYALPENFIFTISGEDRDDRKNFGAILEAFRIVHANEPCKLVVAGRGCEQFRDRYSIPLDGYGADIIFPGWIDQADLPAFYQLATCFVYPSNMEAFPIPVTEALTSGTPLITSDAFGLKELAGDAALLVDPQDPQAIAQAVIDVLADIELQKVLSARAFDRASAFSWERCVQQTMGLLERAAAKGSTP